MFVETLIKLLLILLSLAYLILLETLLVQIMATSKLIGLGYVICADPNEVIDLALVCQSHHINHAAFTFYTNSVALNTCLKQT